MIKKIVLVFYILVNCHICYASKDSIKQEHLLLVKSYLNSELSNSSYRIISFRRLYTDSLFQTNVGKNILINLNLWEDSLINGLDSFCTEIHKKYGIELREHPNIRGFYLRLKEQHNQDIVNYFFTNLLGDFSSVLDKSVFPEAEKAAKEKFIKEKFSQGYRYHWIKMHNIIRPFVDYMYLTEAFTSKNFIYIIKYRSNKHTYECSFLILSPDVMRSKSIAVLVKEPHKVNK
jgi:hypothetical protein